MRMKPHCWNAQPWIFSSNYGDTQLIALGFDDGHPRGSNPTGRRGFISVSSWLLSNVSEGQATQADRIFDRLRDDWSMPTRRYHNTEHLTDCLRELDGSGVPRNVADLVELALWYHDVIYEARGRNLETCSIQSYWPLCGTGTRSRISCHEIEARGGGMPDHNSAGQTSPVSAVGILLGAADFNSFELPRCSIQWLSQVEDGLRFIAIEPVECVLLVLPKMTERDGNSWQDIRRDVDELCSFCEQCVIPLLLVAESDAPELPAILIAGSFDGFIDRSWSTQLARAALDAALARFRAGRNVVDVQQVILSNVRNELGRLNELAFKDDLTRLYNLRYFRAVVGKEHARCERHKHTYAMVYLDVDGLKGINTEHGHAAGGLVLTEIGEVIAGLTRQCDYAFRVGGDEFVVLLVESEKTNARLYAERVCMGVRNTEISFGETTLRVTVSCGVAAFPEDGDNPSLVLQCADEAIFQAKNAGKSRVVCYQQE